MNDEAARLKQDLQTIEKALDLDIWTRRDVRRGLLGDLAGGAAGLFLAVWNFRGGQPEAGMLIFLVMLAAIVSLKDFGFRRNPAPTAGTRRELSFYSRFYFIGSFVIGGYYLWAQRIGMTPPVVLASTVVMLGLWYLFYAISAPSRMISLVGAASLTVCGFLLPAANDVSQMLAWLGIAACVGCWLESALLLKALGGKTTNPNSGGGGMGPHCLTPPPSPVPDQPAPRLTAHAAA